MFAIASEREIRELLGEFALAWQKVTWMTFGLIGLTIALIAWGAWENHKLNRRVAALEARLPDPGTVSTP